MIPLVLPRLATRGIVTAGVLAALVLARPARAQGERVHTQMVVAGGVSYAGGDTATNGGPGFAGHVGLTHQRERLVFVLRAGTNYGGTAPVNLQGGLRDRFDEVALLLGYAVHQSGTSQVALSAGIASVSGERVGTGPAPYFGRTNVPFKARVGVPLQVTISAPHGGSGLGLTAHANLNPEEVFGAVTITYLIGLDNRR